MTEPLETPAHISEVLMCVMMAADFIVTAIVLVVINGIKAGFYKWLSEYNVTLDKRFQDLDDRFVQNGIYRADHPHSGNSPQQQRRHAT